MHSNKYNPAHLLFQKKSLLQNDNGGFFGFVFVEIVLLVEAILICSIWSLFQFYFSTSRPEGNANSGEQPCGPSVGTLFGQCFYVVGSIRHHILLL